MKRNVLIHQQEATLAAIAFAHLCQGHTVLIAAHTNIAVDNAIMKLADICIDSGASAELEAGHVIRYGTAQHQSLHEDDRYRDIYPPALIKFRANELNQQRQKLAIFLTQADTQLSTVAQKKQTTEQWQTKRQQLITHHESYTSELLSLQFLEQQRIASLDKTLANLADQLRRSQHDVNKITQELAEIAAPQHQRQIERTQHQAQIDKLTQRLAESVRLYPDIRTFKYVNPSILQQQLDDTKLLDEIKQLLRQDNQLLAQLQKNRDEKQFALATVTQQIESINANIRDIEDQRNAMPEHIQRTQNLSWRR